MADFRYVVEIQAPPSRVWAALLDVEQWPQWTTSVTSAKRMDFGPLTLGSRTRICQPRLASAVWKVTSIDEARHTFAWDTRTLGARILAVHKVDRHGTGSRVTLSLFFSGVLGGIISRLFRDLNRDYLEREAAGLKRLCEAAASWPAPASTVPSAKHIARSG